MSSMRATQGTGWFFCSLLALCLVVFPFDGSQSATPPAPGNSDNPAAKESQFPEEPDDDPLMTALENAAQWMATFPESELKFDAAIGLHFIGSLLPQGPFEMVRIQALEKAQRDDDNPMQRFWNNQFQAPPEATRKWAVPPPGEDRVNVNRPVIEALYCDRNGIREESLAYIAGPMRDSGGYHTTHALWALVIAHEQGCLSEERFDRLSRPLRSELRQAQPENPVFQKTLDVDLYAERALMLLLAGDANGSRGWVQQLLQQQNEDGSWGTHSTGEPAYYRYHATLVCCWMLALQPTSH